MRNRPRVLVVIVFAILSANVAEAQAPGGAALEPTAQPASRQTMLDYIRSGGVVGYAIILLSVGGVALVVEGFMKVREESLMPPPMVEQAHQLAQRGRFSELLSIARTHPSMFARIVAAALSQGSWGIEAVRESMRRQGEREVTVLRQRMGYIGFLAAVAPMLGLLGTVAGMIQSFKVLGEAKGSASPDELAVGIAIALVTTCEGLVVAVPMMFFHAYFRDRITRIGQKAAGECERLLRIMSVVIENRERDRGAGLPAVAAPRPPQPAPAIAAAAQGAVT